LELLVTFIFNFLVNLLFYFDLCLKILLYGQYLFLRIIFVFLMKTHSFMLCFKKSLSFLLSSIESKGLHTFKLYWGALSDLGSSILSINRKYYVLRLFKPINRKSFYSKFSWFNMLEITRWAFRCKVKNQIPFVI
jgi:hypothetical protein